MRLSWLPLFLLVPAALAQTPALTPAFEGTMHATMHLSGTTVPMTYQLKGHHARIDMEIPPTATTVLIDSDKGEQIVLVPQLKAYMSHKVTVPLTAALAHPPTLTNLSRSETVAGHVCEDYHLDSEKYDGTICLAKDLPAAAFGDGFGMLPPNSALDTLRTAGMPLKVDLHIKATNSGKADENVTMEVTKIEAQPVDDSAFLIPDGWHELANPFTHQ